jgi:threonine/homoserine/homoserine lactone efflux protein
MDLFNHSLFALTLFAFVSSVTPGPNNFMLLASGVNFGFKATIPHMLGIGIGFGIMLLGVALGFMQVFELLPWLRPLMKWAGIVYLLWMAWGLIRAAHQQQNGTTSTETEKKLKPMSFIGAAAFQWINPKAWWMVVSMSSAYLPANPSISLLLLVTLIFIAINIPTVSIWTYLGTQMRRWLNEPKKLMIFNYTMAILLVASLVPIVLEK